MYSFEGDFNAGHLISDIPYGLLQYSLYSRNSGVGGLNPDDPVKDLIVSIHLVSVEGVQLLFQHFNLLFGFFKHLLVKIRFSFLSISNKLEFFDSLRRACNRST